MKSGYAAEVADGRRFEFGKNWALFLRQLNDDKIEAAVGSLCDMLDVRDLAGRSFLDIGCGSGLFSLAAHRLGATVVSFDFDAESVACAEELKRRYCPQSSRWRIETGSALDRPYIESLGPFDIVYSWGVLHHTGAMWQALENAVVPLKPGGFLFIAIYNDQGKVSLRWTAVKKLYNELPRPGKAVLALGVAAFFRLGRAIKRASRFENPFTPPETTRGMSWFRDVIDWVGGYPFEVATADEIIAFFRARGFSVVQLKTVGRRHGCNEFLLRRDLG